MIFFWFTKSPLFSTERYISFVTHLQHIRCWNELDWPLAQAWNVDKVFSFSFCMLLIRCIRLRREEASNSFSCQVALLQLVWFSIPLLPLYILLEMRYAIIVSTSSSHDHRFKVTGESSIEIFATNNEVMYISSRVHVSNKLTRTKYSYWNATATI